MINYRRMFVFPGVQTGSLYNRDIYRVFQGENDCPSNEAMFIVKTNEFGASAGRVFKPECRRVGLREVTFGRAVYILRNPFNMVVSTYNHQNHFTSNETIFPELIDVCMKPRKCFPRITTYILNVL